MATFDSTLFSDANAPGFLKGVAFGTTILPFTHTFVANELNTIGDRTRLAPLRARGGRNRLVAVAITFAELDTDNALRAKLTVYQNAADTEVLAASDIFVTASVAGVLYWIVPAGGITLDDTADDMEASFDFVVTTAATAVAAGGAITGLLFYE